MTPQPGLQALVEKLCRAYCAHNGWDADEPVTYSGTKKKAHNMDGSVAVQWQLHTDDAEFYITALQASAEGGLAPRQAREAIESLERAMGLNLTLDNEMEYDAVRTLIALVRNAALRGGDGWLPIESAPRDGTPVWIADHFSMRVAFWSGQERDRTPHAGLWVDFNDGRAPQFTPTQWYPCPPNPKPASGDGREGNATETTPPR